MTMPEAARPILYSGVQKVECHPARHGEEPQLVRISISVRKPDVMPDAFVELTPVTLRQSRWYQGLS